MVTEESRKNQFRKINFMREIMKKLFCINVLFLFVLIGCVGDQIKNTNSDIVLSEITDAQNTDILKADPKDSPSIIIEKEKIKKALNDSSTSINTAKNNFDIVQKRNEVLRANEDSLKIFTKIGKWVFGGMIVIVGSILLFMLIRLALWLKKFFI
jgi:uncharacterized protein YcfL